MEHYISLEYALAPSGSQKPNLFNRPYVDSFNDLCVLLITWSLKHIGNVDQIVDPSLNFRTN